jgi:RNA polymerase sigma-70 factor (ECF subfamily)
MNTLTTIDELGFAPALQQDVLEDTTSDHALLEATASGDQDAFAELVSRYRNQITSYIYRMTNDYDGAVDLAQETFVRVYRAADRYQRSYAFSTYIYRIATNLAISELGNVSAASSCR